MARREARISTVRTDVSGSWLRKHGALSKRRSPPAPMDAGAVMTNTEWRFLKNGEWEGKTGEWIHLPATDAANLFLWIEQAERR